MGGQFFGSQQNVEMSFGVILSSFYVPYKKIWGFFGIIAGNNNEKLILMGEAEML